MQRNVGNAERIVRVLVGIVLLALIWIGPQTWWGLVGVIPIATGLWGW